MSHDLMNKEEKGIGEDPGNHWFIGFLLRDLLKSLSFSLSLFSDAGCQTLCGMIINSAGIYL